MLERIIYYVSLVSPFFTGMTAKRSKLYDVKVERAGLHDYRLTSDILRTNFKPAIQVDFSHHVFEHLEVNCFKNVTCHK